MWVEEPPLKGSESSGSALSWTGINWQSHVTTLKSQGKLLSQTKVLVRTRHLKTKLVLICLIWFISGFRRSINDCTFLLRCFCLDLSINTPPNHCSAKKRGQRTTITLTFPRYSTWDYSALLWKGDEKGYSAMRTALLSVCLGLKSHGDVPQMHHCCNNGALILCSERNGLWEDLCLKPTKINTEGSSQTRITALAGNTHCESVWFQNSVFGFFRVIQIWVE